MGEHRRRPGAARRTLRFSNVLFLFQTVTYIYIPFMFCFDLLLISVKDVFETWFVKQVQGDKGVG